MENFIGFDYVYRIEYIVILFIRYNREFMGFNNV